MKTLKKIDWSKSHNGVMLCSFERTLELMPEMKEILNSIKNSGRIKNVDDYVVDVKIHMLMPNQYPCIPNWHKDFVPRDDNLNHIPNGITNEKMWLWVSGEPETEWKDESKLTFVDTDEGYRWVEFTQNDVHRGTLCNIHTWRCFVRIIPKKFIHPTTINIGKLRRHTQVYLDANKFTW